MYEIQSSFDLQVAVKLAFTEEEERIPLPTLSLTMRVETDGYHCHHKRVPISSIRNPLGNLIIQLRGSFLSYTALWSSHPSLSSIHIYHGLEKFFSGRPANELLAV